MICLSSPSLFLLVLTESQCHHCYDASIVVFLGVQLIGGCAMKAMLALLSFLQCINKECFPSLQSSSLLTTNESYNASSQHSREGYYFLFRISIKVLTIVAINLIADRVMQYKNTNKENNINNKNAPAPYSLDLM